jgi:hypothetical protein
MRRDAKEAASAAQLSLRLRVIHDGRKSMSDYAFKIGQVVEYNRPARFIGAAPGHYEVVQRMPQEGSEYRYRIKSPNEPPVRVANECDLSVPN